jgi:DNA polymerase-3 subunit gamma/tau
MVGQEHVVRALSNALKQNRLHHAYLMTGTRGVGKTTVARVMAKALNCETGVTPSPCGRCSTCQEIDGGRFVDLIELDAASNTQVDQMRDLLENALYAPTRGRFKVYIIDEVHMLSRSAFNAMLKTLEEPPAHVKFILATTDPQKVPVTVLSRCLQFNLKQIPLHQITAQLGSVLERESIRFEAPALQLIARAAQGSMRDGLSLLDQAIAHGGGEVDETSVRAMLGAVDQDHLFTLLEALADGRGADMMAVAAQMQERSLSLDAALQDLASLLHRLALLQSIPDAVPGEEPDRERMGQLSDRFSAQDLQLYYQIAVQGRAELPLAPDEYAGFTMALLRMLAFLPIAPGGGGEERAGQASGRAKSAPVVSAAAAVSSSRSTSSSRPVPSAPARQQSQAAPAPVDPASQPSPEAATPVHKEATSIALLPTAWPDLVGRLKLGGMARMLAQHCSLETIDGERVRLRIAEAHRHLLEKPYREKLHSALDEHFGRTLHIDFAIGEAVGLTPAEAGERDRQARLRHAVQSIEQDPFVRELVENFDARVVDESIKPIEGAPGAGQDRASQA